MCDSSSVKKKCEPSETELHKKYQQKDDLQRQINQARKRRRVDDGLIEERHSECKVPSNKNEE
jgi:hypothetical protein